ncbi:MAG: hypothetical protein QOI38_1761 [Sphingomonadales bacterium]|jgi:adsorption protein B|nr:hypothetical protein [Sphingomonadales bacterium]
MQAGVAAVDFLLRETALFAAAGFLLLGVSDLALDLLWLGRAAMLSCRPQPAVTALDLDPGTGQGPIAVFVPAWDEARVIARMLRHTLAAYEGADVRIYVGCYPNDADTIGAVRSAAEPRLRLVIGPAPGPTTKADCLNRIWEAMRGDEAKEGRRFAAVLLHDAEDVVHSAELRIFSALLPRYQLVQLPVLPLLDPKSRWIAGHYADEFAEAHAKGLVVRQAIGAALPSAGVGCALAREALDRLAGRHGAPFDGDSLTEDYELGLRLCQAGGRAAFVRLPAGPGRAVVATREYFPATLAAAVAQKARWMRGIALCGWERLGWSGGIAERWMRMRDRLPLLAALLLLAGYLALLLWTLRTAAAFGAGLPPVAIQEPLRTLLAVNGGLLAWRLAMRSAFVTHAYGWREGLRALPRTIVGNVIAMLAAREALKRYAADRGAASWDKTDHAFPREVPAE